MAETDAAGRVARELFLRAMAPTKVAGPPTRQVAELLTDVYLEKGAVLYRKDEAPEHMYFIVSGSVALEVEGQQPWRFGERSVLGVIDAVLQRPRARTAMVTEDVHALRIRTDEWLEVLEDQFELVRGVLSNSLLSLRALVARLAPSGGFEAVPEPLSSVPGATIDLESAARLNGVERMIVLSDVAALKRAGIQSIASLAESAREVRLPANEVLQLGGKERALAIVVGGVVRVEGLEIELDARFGPRKIPGGVAMLPVPQTGSDNYHVRALTGAILLHIRIEDLFDVMEDHFDVALSILAHGAEERERLLNMMGRADAERSSGANLTAGIKGA